jgi:spore coat polysaccharide biosynthesis protein SpsF
MKIGIISQARMTSTRLPGKVLKKIKDTSLLKYHIERLKFSKMSFYIATTTNVTDDPIVEFCDQEEIPYYRGDENNVLSRYYGCAKENDLDVIVRVTSDCPLIDGTLIKKTWELEKDNFEPFDYISNVIERTFPRGFDFEIFSFEYLELAYKNSDSLEDLEHVTPYIHQNKLGKTVYKSSLNKEDKSAYRVTVDTIEDFNVIKALIEQFDAHNKSYLEIIKILDQNPTIAEVNEKIKQKKLKK